MNWVLLIIITFASFLIMEGITWLTHRYIMHGILWFLHKDHHQKKPGFFEKNDTFFLIFAIPGWLCIMLGVIYQSELSIAIGSGITLYGFAYFMVHEVIIHQRFKWFTGSNNAYFRSIRWAHKIHHKQMNKKNGESFGMLWVSKKYQDKVKTEKRNLK